MNRVELGRGCENWYRRDDGALYTCDDIVWTGNCSRWDSIQINLFHDCSQFISERYMKSVKNTTQQLSNLHKNLKLFFLLHTFCATHKSRSLFLLSWKFLIGKLRAFQADAFQWWGEIGCLATEAESFNCVENLHWLFAHSVQCYHGSTASRLVCVRKLEFSNFPLSLFCHSKSVCCDS